MSPSRAEVFHDKTGTLKTAGGLIHSDLMMKDGHIVSKARSKASKKALKSNPNFKVFVQAAKKSDGFELSPKKRTKKYKEMTK